MKQHYLIGLLALLLVAGVGCSKPQRPEFVRIKSLNVQEFTETKVVLGGEAILNNPNRFSVVVKEIDVYVTVNEKAVGKVNQLNDIKVPANSEFEVPLVVDFSPQDVYDNLLSGLLGVIAEGELSVHYEGVIKMKSSGINFRVPIDHKHQIKL